MTSNFRNEVVGCFLRDRILKNVYANIDFHLTLSLFTQMFRTNGFILRVLEFGYLIRVFPVQQLGPKVRDLPLYRKMF